MTDIDGRSADKYKGKTSSNSAMSKLFARVAEMI